MKHSPLITAIDTVRAYTSGSRLLVEVDIVVGRTHIITSSKYGYRIDNTY